MNNSDKVTIVLNSCDKYEALWYPFFELFRIHWPSCSYPLILNTKTKDYMHPQTVGDTLSKAFC